VGPTVYIETTIISYLTARPSKDLVQRAHQQLTRTWWRTRRSEFELYVSPLVLQEAAAGDPARARRRLALLGPLPVLGPTADAIDLSRILIERGAIPNKAEVDACRSEWNRVPFNLELCSHCKCTDAKQD
jgi:hypothetical protein